MNRKMLAILLITIIFLTGIPQAGANRNIFNNFTKLYNIPNVSDAKLNTCKTCMASTTPPVSWNKYGSDLRNNSAFDRNNSIIAMKNIESLDSDGDKFSNIDEIHNSTFPGNESDYPILRTDPFTSTPTGTQPKPTYTIMNGFVTFMMFGIVYLLVLRKRKD